MEQIETIDLSGLFCPEVVLAAARRMRGAANGHRFVILSTDPLSAIDIPVFAARNGFAVIEAAADAGTQRFMLEKRRG